MYKIFPKLSYEKELWRQNFLVIGFDEVGRGALAGPVGVGAVCFDPGKLGKELEQMGIDDSKKLSAEQRADLKNKMKNYVLGSSVRLNSVSSINRIGIVKAVNEAIRSSISDVILQIKTSLPIYVLLDAFNVKYISGVGLKNQKAIIRGDSISISIAAASILAKLHRDEAMSLLSPKYKLYHWDRNKGYGTKAHLDALKAFGPTKWHRTMYISKYKPTIFSS